MAREQDATQGWASRLTYANVMSTIAFVIAFGGGTAYASHLVVESSDIVDGQVKTVDLGNSAVTSAKIRDGAVATADLADGAVTGTKVADSSLTGTDVLGGSLTGGDIADGSVTGGDLANSTLTGAKIADGSIYGADVASNGLGGADILESSLVNVYSAYHAGDVNGVSVQRVEFIVPTGTAETQVLSAASGLRLYASCTGGDLEVYARTAFNARLFSWSVDTENGQLDNVWSLEDFVSANNIDLVNADDGDQSGQTTYMTSSGGATIVNWAADNNTSGAFGSQCAFIGTATTH